MVVLSTFCVANIINPHTVTANGMHDHHQMVSHEYDDGCGSHRKTGCGMNMPNPEFYALTVLQDNTGEQDLVPINFFPYGFDYKESLESTIQKKRNNPSFIFENREMYSKDVFLTWPTVLARSHL